MRKQTPLLDAPETSTGSAPADPDHDWLIPEDAEPAPAPHNVPATPTAAAHTAGDDKDATRWLVLIGLVIAAILEVMDTTIVNVALPQMGGNLGASTEEIAWVSTAYILANVVVLPMTAWLAQNLGRKRYLLISVGVFTVASLLCGVSHSLAEILIWRVLQGATGAALISTSQATLAEIFPAEQQGMVQAIFGLGLGAAPAVAPMLGGWLTDNFSWPWVFLVNVPIGIAALAMITTFLHDSTVSPSADRSSARIDWAGIFLLAAGLGSLQYVLEEGQRYDWFQNAAILRLTIVAVVSIVALVIWELWPTNAFPVVDLRVYKDRGLVGGVIISFVVGFGLYGINFSYAQFAQGILQFTAAKAGFGLLPFGVAIALSMIAVGVLLQRGVAARPLIFFGMTSTIVGTWLLQQQSPASDLAQTNAGMAFSGFGAGFVFIPVTVAAFAGLKGSQVAAGSGQIALGRQLGGSFGIALINTYIVNMVAFHRAHLVEHATLSNPLFMERLSAAAGMFVSRGYDPVSAQHAALALMDQTIQLQAAVKAFNNGFLLVGLTYLAALPLILLLRRGSGAVDASAAMSHG